MNKSLIMKRAHALKKTGLTMSEALKKAWNESFFNNLDMAMFNGGVCVSGSKYNMLRGFGYEPKVACAMAF